MEKKMQIQGDTVIVETKFNAEEKGLLLLAETDGYIEIRVDYDEQRREENQKVIKMCDALESVGLLEYNSDAWHTQYDITETGKEISKVWKEK